ncbi:MAG: hypothetical protein HY705_02520, partial [Gemmatimonadetes bacterium]|nr:hypothetical protein [Gemmatimonadota bacterium]
MTALVHVVAHTHWDREWYHPAGRFQLRLLRLLDDLIELLRRPDFPTFLLDGQAIALDDYLAARPERAADVGRLLRDGRLEAGPWYVLADEFLVSAEALVRNLLAGGRTVRRLGGRPMAVGYAPDAFGHSGALPTILRGFGIEVAVLWRGFGGEAGEEGDLFRWRGADGAEVLMVHLPAPGYGYGANLPCEPAAAGERWRRLRALLEPRARAPHWLVLSGGDHHAAQPDLPEAVDALRALAPDFAFRQGSLEGYTDAVRLWVRGAPETLPTVIGELRGGVRHAWALQGTHGSRLYLKQENAACQRLLERYAEPLGALARARAGADLRAELQVAWRTLLENHPHDSICGTSADVVHREMVTRFARCRAQAVDLVAHAFDLAVGRDAASARAAGPDAWGPGVLVFNPSAATGGGVVEADVALVLHPVSVGRGAVRGRPRRRRAPPLRLRGPGGDVLAHQELGARPGTDLV